VSATAAEKVTADHLRRDAYLYVRQSTLRQVLHNTTSTQRQYELRQRAVALGWPARQIVVIDDDLGRSGATTDGRQAFQRLVADVGMGKAGIVLGLEVSRLARNNADWHRLLEICALTETLILDEDGLYDPCAFNDRLLLGLKGQMRGRAAPAARPAARRGAVQGPPRRARRTPAGRLGLRPRRQRRPRPRRRGAAGHPLPVRHLRSHRLGPRHGQGLHRRGPAVPRARAYRAEQAPAWTPLRHHRVLQILHNPRYAGAFVFGRRKQRKTADGTVRSQMQPRDQWLALIPDAHPGYISWDQFEANQTRLAQAAQAHGDDRRASPPREGPALLQGIAICGRCGDRMTVRYHTRGDHVVPSYVCQRKGISTATPTCTSVTGDTVDQAIATLLLDTVTPLALEVALTVHAELQARADEADRLRHADVERARHAAELARRRYLSVDPDNRLVAASLEADWNDALRQLTAATDDYERHRATAAALNNQQRTRITALAGDFPTLWSDPRTPQRERKRMVRLLIDDVTLAKADDISLHVRFKGGQTTTQTLPAPLAAPDLRRTPPTVITEIDRLLDHHTDAGVAAALNDASIVSAPASRSTPA
jgi:DNA invertase Pin-like site-specific DNA recombinase